MWVIKKPKRIKVKCKFCDAIIKITPRDWEIVFRDKDTYCIQCPYCKNKIYFSKGE